MAVEPTKSALSLLLAVWLAQAPSCGGAIGGTDADGLAGHGGATATDGGAQGGAGNSGNTGTGGAATGGTGSTGAGGTATGGAGNTGAGGDGGDGGGPVTCPPIDGVSYISMGTLGPPQLDPPAAKQPDLNMKMRGWEPTGGALALVDYGGDTDYQAPKLASIFGDDHMPALTQNYRVHDWNWSTNQPGGPIQDWDVTLIAFATTPGEILELPHSGYSIGLGKQARVLLVDDDSITLKYTLEDNVVVGYTIHVVGICVEPSLGALYAANDAQGRAELPAVGGDEPIGRAIGGKILVAIVDSGSYLDPRSKKDWW
jgi:hypothetical protein